MEEHHFVNFLEGLRSKGEVILYNHVTDIPDLQMQAAGVMLEEAYAQECLTYPGKAPGYDHTAALWAAKTVYLAAQLLLFRKHETEEIPGILTAFPEETTVEAQLSADLCLRFLPEIIKKARLIDPGDLLVQVLTDLLADFPYSAASDGNLTNIIVKGEHLENITYRILLCDRITAYKNKALALQPAIKDYLDADPGTYGNELQSV